MPGAQVVHAVPSSFEAVPGGHAVQSPVPKLGATEPASHDEHVVFPLPLACMPGAQGVHAALFAAEDVPAGHGLQTSAPKAAAKDPASHCSQAVFPVPITCMPGAHGVQAVPSAFAYVPDGHASHVVAFACSDTEPLAHCVHPPPSVRNQPAGHTQSSTLLAPAGATHPAMQGVHAVFPLPSANVFTSHGAHELWPYCAENVPEAHSSQVRVSAVLACE